MRCIRVLSVALAIAVASVLQATPVAAQHKAGKGPVRHGVIAGGQVEPGRTHSRCDYAFDCSFWRLSACDPAWARNPAVTTAIVNVGALAGTTRNLVFTAGRVLADVYVEFWRADCVAAAGPVIVPKSGKKSGGRSFVIPNAAKWITVPVLNSTPLTWELR